MPFHVKNDMLCEGSGFLEGEDLPYSWFHYRPIRRPSTWNKDSQRYWTEQREMAIRLDSFGSKTLPFRSQITYFRASGSTEAGFRSRNSQMIPDDKQTFPLLSADYSCAMELITLCKRIEIMSGLFVVLHDIFHKNF